MPSSARSEFHHFLLLLFRSSKVQWCVAEFIIRVRVDFFPGEKYLNYFLAPVFNSKVERCPIGMTLGIKVISTIVQRLLVPHRVQRMPVQ